MDWNNVFIIVKSGQWCAYTKDTGKYIKNINKNERNLVKLNKCEVIYE